MAMLDTKSSALPSVHVRLVDVDCIAKPDEALGRVEVQARGRWEKVAVTVLVERADGTQGTKWRPVLSEAKKLLKARALEMRSHVRRQLGVRDKRAEMLLANLVDPTVDADPARAEKAWRDVREWCGIADNVRARSAGTVLRACAAALDT